MSAPPPVVVVQPDLDRAPDTLGVALTEVAADARRVAVPAHPARRRPRLADLADDVLDALGRVGTRAAVRQVESADLTRLVPFLLTDGVEDLAVFNAGWLGTDGVEHVLAAAAVAQTRVWLVLGETPQRALGDLLSAHCHTWWSLDDARSWWAADACAPVRGTPRETGYAVATGRMTADEARRKIAARARRLVGEPARAFEDDHTRLTVRPAVAAFHAFGFRDLDQLAHLRVRDLAPDASQVVIGGRTVVVPEHLRRPLHRQRLHALAVGQRPSEQLLTYDGSVKTATALWY